GGNANRQTWVRCNGWALDPAAVSYKNCSASDGLGGPLGTQVAAQDLFNLGLQQPRFFVRREAHTDTLGAVGRGARRGYPCHFARDRIALRVIGQRQQHVDIVTELVIPRGRNENAPVREQRNVGRVQGGLFLDRKLDDAGARGGGRGGAHVRLSSLGPTGPGSQALRSSIRR